MYSFSHSGVLNCFSSLVWCSFPYSSQVKGISCSITSASVLCIRLCSSKLPSFTPVIVQCTRSLILVIFLLKTFFGSCDCVRWVYQLQCPLLWSQQCKYFFFITFMCVICLIYFFLSVLGVNCILAINYVSTSFDSSCFRWFRLWTGVRIIHICVYVFIFSS